MCCEKVPHSESLNCLHRSESEVGLACRPALDPLPDLPLVESAPSPSGKYPTQIQSAAQIRFVSTLGQRRKDVVYWCRRLLWWILFTGYVFFMYIGVTRCYWMFYGKWGRLPKCVMSPTCFGSEFMLYTVLEPHRLGRCRGIKRSGWGRDSQTKTFACWKIKRFGWGEDSKTKTFVCVLVLPAETFASGWRRRLNESLRLAFVLARSVCAGCFDSPGSIQTSHTSETMKLNELNRNAIQRRRVMKLFCNLYFFLIRNL